MLAAKVAGRDRRRRTAGSRDQEEQLGEWRMKNTTRMPSGGRRRVILFCYNDIRSSFLLTLSYKY
jgi:hypothetical protein